MGSRREFLRQTAAAGVGFWVAARTNPLSAQDKNSQLSLGIIGSGGQGGGNLGRLEKIEGVAVAALCDVDGNTLAAAAKKHPKARTFADYRKLLEEAKGVDAVVVSTPDHHHAPASIMAMRLGKHVYCEKPLTHTVAEARRMARVAAETQVVTQMGQGYSGDDLPAKVAAIGPVREVHCWTNRPIWPQGLTRSTETHAVPKSLDWDLWLGPAPERPYHPGYHPFKWRGWWDFGTGALGDMACHIMDAAFRGLKLTQPTTVRTDGEPLLPESAPLWCVVHYEFPERGELPPVKLTWYDGGKKPPAELGLGEKISDGGGWLMVGEKGSLLQGKLLPKEKFADFKPPQVEKYPGRHAEWVQAARAGGTTLSNFAYGGNMTEAILLGNVAFRSGRKIEWDAEALKPKGSAEAERFVTKEYRKGWELG